MQRVTNPVPIFLSRDGSLLDGGQVYLGLPGTDPIANPIQVYWDVALTIPADQPLLTLGGVIVNESIPSFAFVAESDYSQKVCDAYGVQITYASSLQDDVAYQPLDDDLTAIAAVGSTAFGRSLLSLPNAAALATATGVAPSVPLSGSNSITGNLGRQGAGVFSYWADPAMMSGRMYFTAVGAADPTSQPGDIWFQLS